MPAAAVHYLFVGERPSQRAATIGATWQNARLAGRTLRDVLMALGIEPERQAYTNLYREPTPNAETDRIDEALAISQISVYAARGYTIVGMGRIVSARLQAHGCAHIFLIHPAARGAIRRRDRYVEHARRALLPVAQGAVQ